MCDLSKYRYLLKTCIKIYSNEFELKPGKHNLTQVYTVEDKYY